MKADRKRIVGFTRISSPVKFAQIKNHSNFFHWLQTNKVWVRPTTLSSSKQSKVGWLLHSHPTYTNFAQATKDLLARINIKDLEIELSPHAISHKNVNDEIMRTNALKVVTTAEDSKVVLDGLITALTKTPREFQSSSTADFKLIPFQDNAIGRDGITELIERQNNYLHKTWAISVMDGGDGNDLFSEEDNSNQHDGSLCQWAMDARSKDSSYLFNSVEGGRKGQTYYLCDKELATEAEEWLDTTFNQILTNYGADRCKKILGGTSHVRREKNVRTTPQISAYLKNLNLSPTSGAAYRANDTLSTPPARKKKSSPRIVYGDNRKSAWTKPIHKINDSDEEGASAGETSAEEDLPMENPEKAGIKRKQSPGRQNKLKIATDLDKKDTVISKLHAAIARANEERIALENATRDNLKQMEKIIMHKVDTMDKNVKQLTSSNSAMETTIQTLHEGQLSMDNNIKMLMLKMGINTNATDTTQQNTSAATDTVANQNDTWIDTQSGDEVMNDATQFDELTDTVFDEVLQQCAREKNANLISPQKKLKTSDSLSLRPGGSRLLK